MQTQCSPAEMAFGRAGGRRIVADFDGAMVSSDAGALLLGETDRAIGLTGRFAACFGDSRSPLFTVHCRPSGAGLYGAQRGRVARKRYGHNGDPRHRRIRVRIRSHAPLFGEGPHSVEG